MSVALKQYSKSNGVDEVDVAVPQLRDGNVLVQVCAASITRAIEDSE